MMASLAAGTANSRSATLIKLYILAAVLSVFVILNAIVAQRDFSDTDTYLFFIDSLYFFRESDWWFFEPLSKMLMIAIRVLSRDTVVSVYIYRYILIFLFPISIYYVYRRSSWEGLIVALALYGPLLGLITMRATPAYVLAALAAVAALDGHWRALAYLFAGFLFHVSAVLALPAVLLILVLHRLGVRVVPNKYLIAGLLSVAAFGAAIAAVGIQYALEFVSSLSYLSKYVIYVQAPVDGANVIVEETKAIHYVFAAAIVLLSVFLVFKTPKEKGLVRVFIAVSMIIYIFIFATSSPVVSSRFSPFYIIPALARTDIAIGGLLGRANSAVIAIASAIVFVVSLQQVIGVQ